MPALALLPGAVRRSVGGLPQLTLKNMYSEPSVTEPTQFALISRPGLSNGVFSFTRGTGPIHAIFYQAEVLSGNTVVISDDDMYVGSSNKGTVPGSSYASIAGNEMGAITTKGDDAKYYDGSTFRSIAFPDSAKVTKVLEQGGRFIFLRASSHKYYWTKPLSNMIVAGDIQIVATAFASAENEPDWLRDAIIYKGYLVLGGGNTIELHAYIGDENLPWVPQVGSTINKGVLQTGCMTVWNQTFVWIDPSGVVYRYNGSGEERISESGIEELIANATEDIWMDTFTIQGHRFLRIAGPDDGDLLLDDLTMQWMQWSTEDGVFLGGHTTQAGSLVYFGSKVDGHVYSISPDSGTSFDADLDADRIFCAGFAKDGGVETIHNLLLRCSEGLSNDLTIQMRFSRDKGNTWTSWIDGDLGNAGDYRTKSEWRALGMVDQPGFLAQFKVPAVDGVGTTFSVSGAYYNEFVMGRSRG